MIRELETAGVRCTLLEGLPKKLDYDVVYVNRLQEERFSDKSIFDKHRQLYRLSYEMVAATQALILDPLPRIDEIDVAADNLPNAVYFQQASYGVPVRMALLSLMLST